MDMLTLIHIVTLILPVVMLVGMITLIVFLIKAIKLINFYIDNNKGSSSNRVDGDQKKE